MSSAVDDECVVANVSGVVELLHIVCFGGLYVIGMTVWRIFFNKSIGKSYGQSYAKREHGEIIKPKFFSDNVNNNDTKWKIDSVKYFYEQNSSNLSKNYKDIKRSSSEKMILLKNSLKCKLSELQNCFVYLHQLKQYDQCCYKFCEEFWKSITMLFVTIYGCSVIVNADYFYDTKLLYIEWPQQFSIEMEFYYKLSFGYHGHRLLWQMFDTKRKDFLV